MTDREKELQELIHRQNQLIIDQNNLISELQAELENCDMVHEMHENEPFPQNFTRGFGYV